MPAGHFMRGNYPLLGQLCRHITMARRIAQLLDKCLSNKDFHRGEFEVLQKQQAMESLAIARLMRSMRLTQQSILSKKTTVHPKTEKNPWNDD
jgi:hypothetical protein